ncbi:MAG: NAD(P)H-dependent oxidoreductase [Clostridiales bacterium]|nr:NAD(P)H-dependent oxidoreductase [Clostridiales bacterium]
MKITVINGTEKHGVTYRLKEIFLTPFKDKAEITEFYLPRDCPHFCSGCITCFGKDEKLCKAAEYTQKIEKALLEADLLVFTTPAYVFHATGAMKAMLDHFGYRWMPHRPAKEMFGKRAVIISQCLGAGGKSSAKDIKDSLSWWGVSYIKVLSFRLMNDILWDKLPANKRAGMESKLTRAANRLLTIDYSKKASAGLPARFKFYIIRAMQRSLSKTHPDTADYKYWENNGWLGKVRPWN